MSRIIDRDTLIDAVVDNTNRDDERKRMDAHIQLAEITILNELCVREGVVTETITVDGGSHPLPDGFISPVRLKFEGGNGFEVLSFIDENAIVDVLPSAESPRYFSIVGNKLLFAPVPTEPIDIEFTYEADVTPLTENNPTNWLLQTYPNIYLYAVCAQVGRVIIDPEMVTLYNNYLGGAISGANRKRERESEDANIVMKTSVTAI